MPTVFFRATILTLVAFAACDPTPDYPPIGSIPPGLIVKEVDLVARDDAPLEVVSSYELSLSMPAGALPAGTRVKVRFLISGAAGDRPSTGLTPLAPSPLGWAVEILPETLVFARPATLTVRNLTYVIDGGARCIAVIFAHASDNGWQLVGQAAVAPKPYGYADATASIERGGVWSMAFVDQCPASDGGADARVD